MFLGILIRMNWKGVSQHKMPHFHASYAEFEAVGVDHGSVQWPKDIDYCPDTLYMESVPVENKKSV
ncbi:MAG: DUF4160 domain-containing protein [Chitinispirillales bacterium]|jgi:hypothetical protein|nr:DUF4160 domain-containing protein [Chitinispirillales bacterium]